MIFCDIIFILFSKETSFKVGWRDIGSKNVLEIFYLLKSKNNESNNVADMEIVRV
jgi:hypothetical protein